MLWLFRRILWLPREFYDCLENDTFFKVSFSSNSEKVFVIDEGNSSRFLLVIHRNTAGGYFEIYWSWGKGDKKPDSVIIWWAKEIMGERKMYVWFLIFWIIYNPAALFLTMQWSLIIKQLISLERTSAVLKKLFHLQRLFFQLRQIAAHIWIKSFRWSSFFLLVFFTLIAFPA